MKTVKQQRDEEAKEREIKNLEFCRQTWENEERVMKYETIKNLNLQGLNIDPKPASKSPSAILPNVPTKKILDAMNPELGILINETQPKPKCSRLNFDPREKQNEIGERPVKIYQRGDQLYAKIGKTNMEINQYAKEVKNDTRNCCPFIYLKNKKYNYFASKQRKRNSIMNLTIGKPYGIQLGSLSISHEYFPVDVRNKQALDVILTAHGISYLKPPAHWAQSDLDTILLTGTELYKATKNIAIDKWSKLTKGFTYKNRFIQVTLSEPILVGKVITETERSMDLYMALERFFEHHKCGVLQTPKLDLYMIKYSAFFVFDPRGRNMDCKRDINGEAALVALTCLENVYHLIINLSKIDVKGPFKIKTLQVTQIMDSMNSTEQFTAIPGDPLKVCRSVDYQVINDRLAVLQGTIHYESKVFGNNAKKQHLAASIMSMVYAKIDPPNTWSKSVLDRVIHFGTNLYKECLSGGNIKDLKLPDIPSKFYIGETYRAGISIVPYLKRVPIEVTRMFSDNPIAIALKEILETINFKMLLLQVDNYTFSIWQMSSTMVYYFFDGFQKDLDGAIDYFKGSSSLFMIGSIEILCQMVVEHIMQLQCRAKSLLDIHGLKITELAQLSRKEHKNRPRLKMQKMDCIRPLAADDVKQFQEVPSYIDSIMPILTANEQILMEEKIPEKPFFQQVTDLNSPSLVCCKSRIYEEIMASLQQKLPNTETPNMCSETADLVRQVHSEILRQAVYEKIPDGASFKSKSCQQENDDSKSLVGGWINECGKWTPCGKMIDVAEKVLLKSDLRCLEENRDAILKGKIPESTCETKAETNNTKSFITLSHERLIKTNFEELPDGSQIIHGTRSMFHIQLSSNIYDYENLSILVGLSAIIISTKYSIASWTPEVIDYVLGCAQLMSEALILENRMSFYTFNEHHLPVVEIKNRFYNVKLLAMENRIWSLLEQYLKNLFETIDRFLIVTSRGSFAVFMRMNFYYVLEYSTCNKLGFRIKNKEFGASCFLRFVDIHSLVRRIQSNHREVHDQQKFLVYRVITSEIKENNAHVDYVSFTESQEKDVVERLRQNRLIFKDQMIKNLKETDEKIQAEKERIRKYREETGEMIPGHITDEDLQHNDIDPNAPSNNNDFELNMSVSQQRVQSSDSDSSPMYQNYYQQMEHSFGYKIGDDGLYKIKGSFGLSKRMELAGEKSKICKFACIYAVMFAVHHPMEQMNFRSVDIILENGFKFQKLSKAGNFAKTETISGILVDKTTYELMIQEYQRQKSNDKQLLLKNKRNEKCHRDRKNMLKVTKNDDDDANSNKLKQMEQKLLNNFFAIQKYAIIQSAHCCMVIIKEKHLSSYHMFDPYDEHDDGKTEIENPLAGWIMFENVEMLLEYVNQRMIMRRHRTLPKLIETIDEPNDHRDLNQNTERDSTEKLIIPFKILSVSVLSYKHVKALKTGYFLFNLHSKTNQLEEKSCHFQQDTANEKIDWICSCKNIPWSRLLVKNDMGFERSLSETKWKDFNVEMENKLYSLWGSININQKAFQQHVGKHHMACSITALVMAHMYNINEWNPILLDSIVIHGGKFFLDTVQKLTQPNYQLKIDDFNGTCSINKFQFSVNVQHVLFGHLYDDDERNFNLNRALDYAFRYKNLPGVILQCAGRNLAIGNIENRDYFMFDCQSFGHPLFAPNEGTAYVLKCCCLKVLLACVVLTLNVKRHTIDFHLYAINTQMIGSVSVVNDDIASEHKNSCTNSNL